LGRFIYAVGGNSEAARISGIHIEHTKIIAYTMMGLLAGVAGIVLTGRLNSANALMAERTELQSISTVVIGEPISLVEKGVFLVHLLAHLSWVYWVTV
jgi:ribose/xylose/arabinose/galactoside ABC-type transport system permease subunit